MKTISKEQSRSLSVLWLILILLFAVCTAYPVINIFFTAKINDYKEVFSDSLWFSSLKNTLLECILSSSFSVIIGYFYAFTIVKCHIPFKKFFSYIPIIHLITPPFVSGLSFILLFGKQGVITKGLLNLDSSIYGLPGIVLAQVLCFFPIAYLINLQVLKGINTNLENAARSMGAGKLRVFLTVTVPLSKSGIISSFLFIAVNVLSDFGNPMIVGERFSVLAVEIYNHINGWATPGTAAVYGIILVIPSVILFTIQFLYLKKIQLKTSTIGSKVNSFISNDRSFVSKPVNILCFIFVLLISAVIIAQFYSLIEGSFQTLWTVDSTFTTRHILTTVRYSSSLFMSILFALISALLSITIASCSAFITNRTNLPLRKTTDIFSQIPSAIPGTLLGLALKTVAAQTGINNSGLLIVIAMTISFLPFAYRMISQSYNQIKTNLDDNARSLGSNQISVLRKILIPLSSKSIFSGFTYNFIRGAGTLSTVIFLFSFNTKLTSIYIIDLAETGDWGKAAALSLVLTLMTFSILLICQIINKLISKRIGR